MAKKERKGKTIKEFILNILSKINFYIHKYKKIIIMCIPFLLMHIFMTIIGFNVRYSFHNYFAPLFFSATWILLFVGISMNIKKILGKILYVFIVSIFAVLFLTNGVYFSMMSKVFDFTLLESAGEGAPYILTSLKNCNPLVYIAFLIVIASIVFALKFFESKDRVNLKNIAKILLIFIVSHTIAPILLGVGHTDLTWSSWRNARNIYNSYNDANKSLVVSGFYEYEIRNFYMTFLKTEGEESLEDVEFLEEAFSEVEKGKNKYTGSMKGKNLIIVQLEGMDDWIVTKEDTPTIYKMMHEGINFSNHFSFYNGGGSTFNSEFAINTGFVTPFSYTKNAYSFNKNAFPYSLPNVFKDLGYHVNAFHMNTGEYYSRTINYQNWGYDNYYGLKDMGKYSDSSYELDRTLILDEKFNDLMFPTDYNFVDYIITYSGHLPFTNTKGVCKQLYEMDHAQDEEYEFVEMSEEECIRRQNKETDYMMELLLENLKEKGLLNNTVIVVATDHYLYTVEDENLLARYKETSNNLINHTPFFIWSNNIKSTQIKEVTTQLNILPTILNLYGVNYNPNNYIGSDALDSKYEGLAFFSDYSWYDGNVYVEGGLITNGKKISQDDLENKNYRVSYLTKKNDLALKYNHFGRQK